MKIVTFFVSVLTGIAFPSCNIWLTNVLSSLARKPKLLSSLHRLLSLWNIVGHSERHERNLEKERINNAVPTQRLYQKLDIWNLAVIDNIDFKQKTFSFGNIYDTTRNSSHATLRMAFQSVIPNYLATCQEELITLEEDNRIFGMNFTTQEALDGFQSILENLLDFRSTNEGNLEYNQNFDVEIIKKAILEKFEHGCKGSSSHVVILEPGDNPNSDQAILGAATMYKADFNLQETAYLDIVADEAIYRRLVRCQEQWPQLRPLLGQWHTSKDFCSVLIVLFSSYGLLNLARRLGVQFLDKFEAAVDYRTTSRVLDFLWVAVGVSINIFTKRKNINLSEIMNENTDTNIFLKIWYLYYQWAGIWKAHRIGMRIGNHNLQRDALAAALPLFPSAGKSNYAVAIAQHLSTLTKYPKLNEILQHVGAFRIPKNIDDDGSENQKPVCFGFDEALETFGVHFIKQNISGNIIDEMKLKANIKAAQSERERVDLLLSEYLEDTSISQSERAINSRRKALWELVEDLVMIFDMTDPLSHQIFKDLKPPEIKAPNGSVWSRL
ncbi:uncharacterized protein OCT59_011254 [Rhizophagus irregularis]|nr:hypothetical protein OCT59_011254 [Rhizophagus irregularis]GBC23677.1 hypothetical protein GLOIN_2v1482460 [Rhizophagus irregularis DAOM 181602=DAOM 197198]